MDLTAHHISDSELSRYGFIGEPGDDNMRVKALLRQQLDPQTGWRCLIRNMERYSRIQKSTVNVRGIDVILTLNETRAASVNAQTFEAGATKRAESQCFLCQPDEAQRGILTLNHRYLILINPGITIPGDLTIASVSHRPQVIADSFSDMIALARRLTSYSIFYNGAMAGASIPHFHFQAGLKNSLIGEEQISQLLEGLEVGCAQSVLLHQSPTGQIYWIKDFSRATYLIRSKDREDLEYLFNTFSNFLIEVDKEIVNIPHIPDFGSYIEAMDILESEPRMNLMLKYDPLTAEYLLAIFPKISNRPTAYFRSPEDQIIVGIAIKESLGNLICCRWSDYQRLQQSPELTAQMYRDTSINDGMMEQLNRRLTALESV
ncbi:MAG TPA: DUF4922 domain-containing protein [Candidatus Marinimicrobia bacterium]|nr:DUF4922 domain-containing protein [Candidatus Neomarinimicrobiota bacterium]